MATGSGDRALPVTFLLMDVEAMDFETSSIFSGVWSISAFGGAKSFSPSAARLLKSGATFAIIDWFKKPILRPQIRNTRSHRKRHAGKTANDGRLRIMSRFEQPENRPSRSDEQELR